MSDSTDLTPDIVSRTRSTLKDASDDLNLLAAPSDAHTNDIDNPHETDKAHLLLDLVENFPLSSNSDIVNGLASNRFVTTQLVGVAYDNHKIPVSVNDRVRKPVPIRPTTGPRVALANPTFEATTFATPGGSGETLLRREYQLDVTSAPTAFAAPVHAWSSADDAPSIASYGLSYNTEYVWRCRDILQDEAPSEWSEAMTFKTEAYVTQAIQFTQPSNGGGLEVGQEVQWQDQTASDPEGMYTFEGYELQFSYTSDFAIIQKTVLTTDEFWVADESIDFGVVFARVRPEFTELPSGVDWSDVLEFDLSAASAGPTVITYPQSGGQIGDGGSIYWEGYATADPSGTLTFVHYEVQVSDLPDFSNLISNVTTTDESFAIDTASMTLDSTYYARVRPTWEGGATSAWVSVDFIYATSMTWVAVIGGADSDLFFDVAYDGSHIYAAGYQRSEIYGEGDEGFVTKWDTSGNLVWQRTYDSNIEDRIVGVGVHNSTLALLISQERPGDNREAFVTATLDNATPITQKRFNPGVKPYVARGMTVLDDGTCWVAGYQQIPGQIVGGQDAYLEKWDIADGENKGQWRTGGGGKDAFHDITALTYFGDVRPIAVGSFTPTGDTHPRATVFVRLQPDYADIYRVMTHGDNATDEFLGVCPVKTNAFCAVGYCRSQTYGGSAQDALITKWSINGNLEWKFRYGDSNGGETFAYNAIADDNFIYVVGERPHGSVDAGFVMCLDHTGTHQWSKCLKTPAGTSFYSIQIVGDYLCIGGLRRGVGGSQNVDALLLTIGKDGATGAIPGMLDLTWEDANLGSQAASHAVDTDPSTAFGTMDAGYGNVAFTPVASTLPSSKSAY